MRLKCALRLLHIMFSSEILMLYCFRIYIILSYLIFPLKQGTSYCAKFMESLSTDSLIGGRVQSSVNNCQHDYE